MDVVMICVLLLAAGLISVLAMVLIGQVLLFLGLAATVMLDLGANLSAVGLHRPRSRRR